MPVHVLVLLQACRFEAVSLTNGVTAQNVNAQRPWPADAAVATRPPAQTFACPRGALRSKSLRPPSERFDPRCLATPEPDVSRGRGSRLSGLTLRHDANEQKGKNSPLPIAAEPRSARTGRGRRGRDARNFARNVFPRRVRGCSAGAKVEASPLTLTLSPKGRGDSCRPKQPAQDCRASPAVVFDRFATQPDSRGRGSTATSGHPALLGEIGDYGIGWPCRARQ